MKQSLWRGDGRAPARSQERRRARHWLLLLGLLLVSACGYRLPPETLRSERPPHTLPRSGGGWVMSETRLRSLSPEARAEYHAWFARPQDLRGRWKTRRRLPPAMRALYRAWSRRTVEEQDGWRSNAPEDPRLDVLHSPWVREVLHPLVGGAPARVLLRPGERGEWTAYPGGGGRVVLRMGDEETSLPLHHYAHELGQRHYLRSIRASIKPVITTDSPATAICTGGGAS